MLKKKYLNATLRSFFFKVPRTYVSKIKKLEILFVLLYHLMISL